MNLVRKDKQATWHPQGPIRPTPPPRATTFHAAPCPARVTRRAVVRGGVVTSRVVARGGWVDVVGPCGRQAWDWRSAPSL